jgi:hypothetical protein
MTKRYNDLAANLATIEDAITGIEELTAPPPTPEQPAPTPPIPSEVSPDDMQILVDEVNRIIQASQGKEPPPPTWAKILSIAIPSFSVIDAINKKAWGTSAEQAATGAHVAILSAITEAYGSTTFAAFMYEEATQALGMPGWIAYNAGNYKIALDTFNEQYQLILQAQQALEAWHPLMPLTYPGFKAFFHASRLANEHWLDVINQAAFKAGLPTNPTLVINSRPSGAQITLDGIKTDYLTPETLKTLAPGQHTITVTIPATDTTPERSATQTITLQAGKKVELLIPIPAAAAPTTGAAPPTAPATLRVSSSPSEGSIILDGTDTGTLTPETLKNLTPGQHTVTVIIPPRQGWPERRATVTITLAPGEKREILLTPTPP